MNILIHVSLVAAILSAYSVSIGWAPRALSYMPELCALAVLVVVYLAGVRNRMQDWRPIYLMLFSLFGILLIFGALANKSEPGPIFAGCRTYLRAIPFFFLPAVVRLSDRQLRTQLLTVCLLAAIQLPIAAYQRMDYVEPGSITGDYTFGTIMNSAALTIFSASSACVLTGFYIKKFVPLRIYVPGLVLFLAPTLLNESKAALIIVPLSVGACFVLGASKANRVKYAAIALVTGACFVAVFVPVYDYFMKPRWGYGIVDFFLMDGRLEGYLDRGSTIGEYSRSAGKLGGLRFAASRIIEDPVTAVFGYGIGSVSDSALGTQFTGRFFNLYEVFLESSAIVLTFEFGFAGLLLVLAIYWQIFRDCVHVGQNVAGLRGALATGWIGVMVTVLLGTFYHNIVDSPALSYPFWYFSGLVAASVGVTQAKPFHVSRRKQAK